MSEEETEKEDTTESKVAWLLKILESFAWKSLWECFLGERSSGYLLRSIPQVKMKISQTSIPMRKND
jgi:hypothetical protein